MTPRCLSPVLCLAAAFALAGVVHADDGRRPGRGAGASPPRAAEQRARAPEPRSRAPEQRLRAASPRPRARRNDELADSVRRVQSRTGGQVLSAERVPFDGRDISRVKVVDERGRVRVYMDDPASRRGVRPTRGDDD
jgi:hypothetical protein